MNTSNFQRNIESQFKHEKIEIVNQEIKLLSILSCLHINDIISNYFFVSIVIFLWKLIYQVKKHELKGKNLHFVPY